MPGVYISYPFCQQKCSFCNFASGVGGPEIRARYHAVLAEELQSHEWAWFPETVYLGGGTPSLMPPAVLAQLMKATPREKLAEVTMECAPGTISAQLLESWTALGINRVSLGVQSFVAEELRQTGRRHTAETVERDSELLRAYGIQNINLDLIAGLPEQTAASWELSLNWIERLNVPHVSVYIFEVDEDSRLGKEFLVGGVRYGAALVPSDDLTAELYERAVSRLAQVGVHRYEISNFARPGFESRHNLKYWQLEPYIGFGLDAHSFDGRTRWSNSDELRQYLRPGLGRSASEAVNLAEEHFFVGLRLTNGIEPTGDEWTRFARPIAKWEGLGLLERRGSRLRLSPEAVLLSNEIFQEFLDV